jgi:mandelate racemase
MPRPEAVQVGENFYGPRALFRAIQARGRRLHHAGSDAGIGGITGWLRAAAIAGVAGVEMSTTHLYPEVAGI